MAIKLTNENGQRMVGVAYAEPSLHSLGVSEFLESDQFTNVEVCARVSIYILPDDVIAIYIYIYLQMILVQLNPKECLLVANDNSADAGKLRHALSRSNVLITDRKRSES